MRKFCRRRKRFLRILVLDTDVDVRRQLVGCYHESIRCHFTGQYDCEEIYRAVSIADAKRRIEDGLDPYMIIFSEGFPEREIDELREWLNYRRLAIIFVLLRLPEPIGTQVA